VSLLQDIIQHGGECESNRKMSPHEFQGEGFELQGKLMEIFTSTFYLTLYVSRVDISSETYRMREYYRFQILWSAKAVLWNF